MCLTIVAIHRGPIEPMVGIPYIGNSGIPIDGIRCTHIVGIRGTYLEAIGYVYIVGNVRVLIQVSGSGLTVVSVNATGVNT